MLFTVNLTGTRWATAILCHRRSKKQVEPDPQVPEQQLTAVWLVCPAEGPRGQYYLLCSVRLEFSGVRSWLKDEKCQLLWSQKKIVNSWSNHSSTTANSLKSSQRGLSCIYNADVEVEDGACLFTDSQERGGGDGGGDGGCPSSQPAMLLFDWRLQPSERLTQRWPIGEVNLSVLEYPGSAVSCRSSSTSTDKRHRWKERLLWGLKS